MNKKLRLALLLVLFSLASLKSSDAVNAKIVKISAKKFEYAPSEIVVKRGVPTILQITSEDRTHGFNVPSLSVRVDIVPGKVAEVLISPPKSGEIDFFCDVFCGSGHEAMSGKIRVVD
ncbi:MAG: cupredoxin domain-containing protein [Candidatus Obscuribacterales bacterium]|jgi:cytochrome c oxidase subunit 2